MSPVFVPAGDLDVPAGFSKTGDTLLGFGGLTCDESANLNKAFNPSSTKTHPLTGYDHAMPFDDIAYLKLPRQLIPGLFDLSNPDLFRGFKKIIGEARATLAANPSCIRQAINKATLFITADSHEESINRLFDPKSTLINHSYYCPSKESDYSLDSVLKARCHFLQVTCAKIEAKIPIDQIDLDSLQQYKQSQLSPIKPLQPICLVEPVLPDIRLCLAV